MPKVINNVKITLTLTGWRYFFMVNAKRSNKVIIYVIMKSLSIAITSLCRDDGITAQLSLIFSLTFPFRNNPAKILYYCFENISIYFNKL